MNSVFLPYHLVFLHRIAINEITTYVYLLQVLYRMRVLMQKMEKRAHIFLNSPDL